MNQAHLENIARIRTGYQFRERAPFSPDGRHSVVHLPESSRARLLDELEFQRVNLQNIKSSDLITQGDILLRAKGNNHYAVYVDRSLSDCLASGLALIIQCDKEKLYPPFLAWYLNQAPAQSFLSKISAGTSIPVVGKKPLLEMPVPLPPLEKQIVIGNLYQMLLREEQLTRELMTARENFINGKMLSLVEGETNLNAAR
jgi:restriction endonuclease S subunit